MRFRVSTFALAIITSASPLYGEPDFDGLSEIIRSELKDTNTPGAAIGIVRGEKLVFAKGFGVASVETGEAVTPQQLFRLGSTTKVFTAAAVVSLARDGKLKLDEPICKYVKKLSEPIARLTVHQLLTHTSGLADGVQWLGLHDDSALGARIRSFTNDQFFTEPNRIYSYSNPGYWTAGLVAEEVGGKPFADVVRDKLLVPLRMKRSTFRPTMAMTYPLAQGHELSRGEVHVVRPHADNAATWPAGSMFSNVEELSRFAIAMLHEGKLDGNQVLDVELVRMLTTPHVPIPGAQSHYGYGLRVGDYRDVPVIEHGGARSGYGSLLRLFPKQKAAVIMLVNRTGGRLPKSAEKASELAGDLPPAAKPRTTKSIAVPDLDLKELPGEYRNSDDMIEILNDNGVLWLKHNSVKAEMRKLGIDRFVAGTGDVAVVRCTKPAEIYVFTGGRAYRKTSVKAE